MSSIGELLDEETRAALIDITRPVEVVYRRTRFGSYKTRLFASKGEAKDWCKAFTRSSPGAWAKIQR